MTALTLLFFYCPLALALALALLTRVPCPVQHDGLACSDVLLGGPSSFTSLAAALNQFGVKVVPRFNNPAEDKFLGIDRTVGQGRILQGDMVRRQPGQGDVRNMILCQVFLCGSYYHSQCMGVRTYCLIC